MNVKTLIYYIKLGVLDPTQPITIKTLLEAGIVKKVKYGVKVLARVSHLLFREPASSPILCS